MALPLWPIVGLHDSDSASSASSPPSTQSSLHQSLSLSSSDSSDSSRCSSPRSLPRIPPVPRSAPRKASLQPSTLLIVHSDADNVSVNRLNHLEKSLAFNFQAHGVDARGLHNSVLPRRRPTLSLPPEIRVWSDLDSLSPATPDSYCQALRPLIIPMAITSTSTARDLPGSPPDLTDSKSSKSSSFHSSSLADTVGCDLNHFEDISLDDVRAAEDRNDVLRTWSNRSLTSRPKPSPAFYAFTGQQSFSSRDLTAKSIHRQSRSVSATGSRRYQLPVPGPRSSRQQPRGTFLQPGPPSFRSRSPSPVGSPTAVSIGTNTSSTFSAPIPHSIVQKRRSSWQPGRKTVQELEDEYHDSDEEIPDDAVVWNVPISPRHPHQRDFRRSQTDPTPIDASFTALASKNLTASLRISTQQISNDLYDANNLKSSSTSPAPNSPVSDASSDFQSLSSNKTREAALTDLCKEARELTAALEVFAEESEKDLEAKVQSGHVRHMKASSVDMCLGFGKSLPPVRKNDPLVDPLPPSREKERFLTRTRPSWLPPKNPKEEARHLKEFKKMMEQAAEAERKRVLKIQKLQAERDVAAAERKAQWDKHVLPNWETAVLEPNTKDLWWHGVPGHRRGEIWGKAVGNELGLTAVSFEAALERAKQVEMRDNFEGDDIGATFMAIKKTAETLYPELSLFQPGCALHQSLLDVTMAYAMYRPDVGLNTEITTLAALILLNLPTVAGFITLANILHRPLPAALLAGTDMATLTMSTNLVLATLRYQLPNLYSHLDVTIQGHRVNHADQLPCHDGGHIIARPTTPLSEEDPTPEITLSSVILPILKAITISSSRINIEVAARIWDVAVFEGDSALIRATVAVLAKLEGKLYGDRATILKELSVSTESVESWGLGDIEELMETMKETGKVDGEA
jgi:hypothetical protein